MAAQNTTTIDAELRAIVERRLPGLQCTEVWMPARWVDHRDRVRHVLSVRVTGELDDLVRHGIVTREQALTLPLWAPPVRRRGTATSHSSLDGRPKRPPGISKRRPKAVL
jgi:hypothetical protein